MRSILFFLGVMGFCAYYAYDAVRDMFFLKDFSAAKELTIDELKQIPAGNVPRYIKLKDIQIVGGSYVEETTTKRGSKISSTYYYPLYSKAEASKANSASLVGALTKMSEMSKEERKDTTKANQIAEEATKGALSELESYVVVKDGKDSKAILDAGELAENYVMEGRSESNAKEQTSIIKILQESGYKINDKAIVMVLGEKAPTWGWTIGKFILCIVGFLGIGLMGLASFRNKE
jgi:hypothetical protein